MSKEYEFEIYGHQTILSTENRKLKIYFSEPQLGVNEETGIVLFIAGFRGNANSNVYKKMRREFADKYNLITVQCDYLGWEFMQSSENPIIDISKEELEKQVGKENIEYIYEPEFDLQKLIEVCSKYKINLNAKEALEETLSNYNEMGLIQAIDNISAVLSVIEILKDNGYDFNENKIILYGQSQGAYLSYLCNALAPSLFSLLIDNSSWLIPQYLKSSRYLFNRYDNCMVTTEFNYLASTLDYDKEILSINSLYKKFRNECDVICYHGTNDNLISHNDKSKLKYVMHKFYYNEVNESKVDGKIFKSASHGLDADFLELFDYTIQGHKFEKRNTLSDIGEDVHYETEDNKYTVNYDDVLPRLEVESKK